MAKTTDKDVLQRALELLADNLLPSLLPARLMLEFKLSQDRAARLASEALKKHREKTP